MNKFVSHLLPPLATATVIALVSLAAAAQELPLVSRDLQFHATPTPGGAASRPATRQSGDILVDLSNLPRVPLPPGTTILTPQIDSRTGAYLESGGERGVVIPEAPAQQSDENLPSLTVGETYLPPWFDDIRNIRGGRGPAGGVPSTGPVRPEDLRITPAPENDLEQGLPEEPPAAPFQRSAAPAADPIPAPPAAPFQRSAAPAADPIPAPTARPVSRPAEAQTAPPPAPPVQSPVPLVSRKLNFQY